MKRRAASADMFTLLTMSPLVALVLACMCAACSSLATATGALEKPGACSTRLAQRICSRQCDSDGNCPDDLKCCATTCGGFVCSHPVTPTAVVVEKKGTCPEPPKKLWVCSDRCSTDADCRKFYKCCVTRCGGKTCLRPVEYSVIN